MDGEVWMFNWLWGPKQRPVYTVFTREFDQTLHIDELANKLSAEERAVWAEKCQSHDIESAEHLVRARLMAAEWLVKLRSIEGFVPEDWAVSILVDHSGSLRGQRATIACVLTEVLADFLHRMGVQYEILGFTTLSWKGGQSRQKWIREARRRPRPGRLADLLHIIYRSAEDSEPGAPHSIRHLLRDQILKENIDGEALLWAGERISRTGRKNKAIIVISDGAPVDDSTLLENPPNILWEHLKAVIRRLVHDEGFELLAIGLDHDLAELYEHSITLDQIDTATEKAIRFVGSRLEEMQAK
jgi:cobaltochelatase CobT